MAALEFVGIVHSTACQLPEESRANPEANCVPEPLGAEMPVADYLAVKDILNPLWEKVGPEVTNKVRYANHVRLFDAAKKKVRAWETAHAKDNVWDLPVSTK